MDLRSRRIGVSRQWRLAAQQTADTQAGIGRRGKFGHVLQLQLLDHALRHLARFQHLHLAVGFGRVDLQAGQDGRVAGGVLLARIEQDISAGGISQRQQQAHGSDDQHDRTSNDDEHPDPSAQHLGHPGKGGSR